jgi:DNA (cytosine-5)-methyltransferase 1
VPRLAALGRREILEADLESFATVGEGYHITWTVLRAEQFGVPQRRRRLLIIGVRKDLGLNYHFPAPDHSALGTDGTKLYTPHGDAIAGLPEWPVGDFYDRADDPEGNWSWYYMSRNRKAAWDAPSYTILANERHPPIHPASPAMRMVWMHLSDGYKQGWEFRTATTTPMVTLSDRRFLDRAVCPGWNVLASRPSPIRSAHGCAAAQTRTDRQRSAATLGRGHRPRARRSGRATCGPAAG